MRFWGIALATLILLAPAASSLKQEHGFPLRMGDAPWAQLACEVLFESNGRQDCHFQGAVSKANTVRIDVVGTASIMLFGDKEASPYPVAIIPTTVCSGSCVVKFGPTTGVVNIWAYVTGTTNTFVHAGVGAGMESPRGTILV